MNRLRFNLAPWRAGVVAGTLLAVLGGCGPSRLTVPTDVPPLLVVPMPVTMGLRMPKSFTEYTQKENVEQSQWEIDLGKGQADAMRRVMGALFEHVVEVGEGAPGAAAGQHLAGIIETTLDSYVYLLPSPASGASEFYSATIGFKVNLEAPDGTLLGSWVYEGYGSVPERGLTNFKGVKQATSLAIRDACANLAVHLPEQELLRNLLASPPPSTSPAPSAPAEASPSAPTVASPPAPAEASPSAPTSAPADASPSAPPVAPAKTAPDSAPEAQPPPASPPSAPPQASPPAGPVPAPEPSGSTGA